jgi:RHS repeat-associated protein
MKSACPRFALLSIGLALELCARSWAQTQILETYGTTLTTYQPTSGTTCQGAYPMAHAEQRGVNFDGTLRSPSPFGWSVAGNPFGDVQGSARLGALQLGTGTYAPTEIDWSGPNPGQARWVIGRTFNQRQQSTSNGPQGKNWFQSSQPEIVLYQPPLAPDTSTDVLYLVYGADRYLEFQRTAAGDTTFKGKNGAAGVFEYVSGSPDTYIYHNQAGTSVYFFGGNTSSGRANWQIWKVVDAAGNTAFVGDASTASTAAANGYNADKTILKAYDSSDNDGRRYTYSYSTIDSTSRLTEVKVETKTGGTWTSSPTGIAEVARVTYDYYTGNDTNGPNGYLKSVAVRTSLSPSGSDLSTGTYLRRIMHYRYYSDVWANSDGRRGNVGMLKLVLGYEGARNFDYTDDSTMNDSFLSASDSALKPYSLAYFEYPSSGTDWRPSSVFFNGECGCSGSTNGTHNLTYGTSSSYSTYVGNTTYDTGWASRTIDNRPDGTYQTLYFDEAVQPLSSVVTDSDPSGSPSSTFATEVVRNSSGQVTEVHSPASNSSYTHSTGSFTRSTGHALITVYDRVSSGDMTGFPEATRVKDLDATANGSSTYMAWRSYTSSDYKVVGTPKVIRPFYSASRAFFAETSDHTDSSSYNETAYTWTVWGSGNTDILNLAPKQITTTMPAVSTGHNGRGTTSNDKFAANRYLNSNGVTVFESAPAFANDGTDTIKSVYYATNADDQVTLRMDDKKKETTWTSSYASKDNPSSWTLTLATTAADLKSLNNASFDAQGRPTQADVLSVGGSTRTTVTYYTRLKDQRLVTLSFPRVDGTPTYYGPAGYTVTNHAGKVEFSGTIAVTSSGLTDALSGWISTTSADPITALQKGTLARMSTNIYSSDGNQLTESRAYFSIPGSGAGSAGSNYDPTTYGYDTMGRRWRTKAPTTDITRLEYDTLGRTVHRFTGTNDHSFTGGESSGTDNMVKVEELAYDANSRVTSRTLFIQDGPTDDRVTSYDYDYRGRLLLTTNPQAPHVLNKYDNMSRAIAVGQYSTAPSSTADPTATTSTNRTALSETAYDERGQVYQTTRWKIDQSNGNKSDALTSNNWYDAEGRVIKVQGEQLAKTTYDRLGRATVRSTLAKVDDSAYADAATVTGDTVLEEADTYYDDSTGLALMNVRIQRHPGDTTTSGALNIGTTASLVDYTSSGGKIKGRAQITAMWYDTLNRLTDTMSIGTNGLSNYDRSGASVASRDDTHLVTSYSYNDNGTTKDVTDPRGLVTRTLYDDAGRRTATIGNYVDGIPSGDNNADDVYTRFEYTNGLMTKMWVDLNGNGSVDTNDQVTTYIYGSTKGTPSQMKIASGNLLRAVKYPDTSNSGTTVANIDSDSSTVVSYAYNAQGQQTYTKDQAGNVIETTYDTAGRQTNRLATTIVTGFDSYVQRIATTYLARGPVDKVTQYSTPDLITPGTVRDELQYARDDWANLSAFKQDVDSVIGGSGRATFEVDYAYDKATPTGGRATVRRSSMTFPDGTSVSYKYNSGEISDYASRVDHMDQGGVTLATYEYLGAGQVTRTTLNEAKVDNYLDPAEDHSYSNIDQFNRVKHCVWTKSANFYSVDLTYDRDSGITLAVDNILKGASTNDQYDASYTNDNLNRLLECKEGKWNGSSISICKRDEQWTLSQPGDPYIHKLDKDGDGSYTGPGELNDTGTFDKANKWTKRDIHSDSSVAYFPAYDGNGSMTDDNQSYKYVWDAFGRLVTVKNQSSAVVAEYKYNGLGYRIGWHYDTNGSGTTTPDGTVDGFDAWLYFCYDDRWRIVATYHASDANDHPKERFVWHNAGANGLGGSSYIDSIVLRDKDANTNWCDSSDGVLEDRIYYCQNWRADVSVIVGTDGTPIEWIKYSAYGVPSSFALGDFDLSGKIDSGDDTAYKSGSYRTDMNFDGDTDKDDDTAFYASYNAASTGGFGVLSRSLTGNRIGYAGYQWDPVIGSYHVRHRVYNPGLGRWLQRDPLGISLFTSRLRQREPVGDHEGPNSYAYVKSGPLLARDPSGLCGCRTDSAWTRSVGAHEGFSPTMPGAGVVVRWIESDRTVGPPGIVQATAATMETLTVPSTSALPLADIIGVTMTGCHCNTPCADGWEPGPFITVGDIPDSLFSRQCCTWACEGACDCYDPHSNHVSWPLWRVECTAVGEGSWALCGVLNSL